MSILVETIGKASTLMDGREGRSFDSEKAIELAKKAEQKILRYIEGLESEKTRAAEVASLIRGHMEAMRPLLDEWSKLKEDVTI